VFLECEGSEAELISEKVKQRAGRSQSTERGLILCAGGGRRKRHIHQVGGQGGNKGQSKSKALGDGPRHPHKKAGGREQPRVPKRARRGGVVDEHEEENSHPIHNETQRFYNCGVLGGKGWVYKEPIKGSRNLNEA